MKSRLGSLLSHPFRRKKRKGWGTEGRADCEVRPVWVRCFPTLAGQPFRLPDEDGAPMVARIGALQKRNGRFFQYSMPRWARMPFW